MERILQNRILSPTQIELRIPRSLPLSTVTMRAFVVERCRLRCDSGFDSTNPLATLNSLSLRHSV
jgi:hypothetical protein